jgi:hypothetical protein
MEFLQGHLKRELDLELKLVELHPHELQNDVEVRHEYDLAYYRYDYPDPTFPLRPLLDRDSRGPRGTNFLGYSGVGGRLDQLCREVYTHRDFQRVRTYAHTIHQAFVQQEMPFIPLWQLDRHIAFSNSLEILDDGRSSNTGGCREDKEFTTENTENTERRQ